MIRSVLDLKIRRCSVEFYYFREVSAEDYQCKIDNLATLEFSIDAQTHFRDEPVFLRVLLRGCRHQVKRLDIGFNEKLFKDIFRRGTDDIRMLGLVFVFPSFRFLTDAI